MGNQTLQYVCFASYCQGDLNLMLRYLHALFFYTSDSGSPGPIVFALYLGYTTMHFNISSIILFLIKRHFQL